MQGCPLKMADLPKESTKKNLELINQQYHRTQEQYYTKSIIFPSCTNYPKKKLRKQFNLKSKGTKFLGLNLSKVMSDIYTENNNKNKKKMADIFLLPPDLEVY